jgi:thioredoxin 1
MATREITLDNLPETIDGNEIVLLDFWAAWCGPCRMFGPIFEEASQRHPDVVFGKIDTEAQQELAGAFGIRSIPTLIAFRDRVLVFAEPGMLSGAQLDTLIEAVRGLDMEAVRAQLTKDPEEATA